MFILKDIKQFNIFVCYRYLDETGMSFTSYVKNVFIGNIWGDYVILGAISKMWNICVTVLSPNYKIPWRLFHNSGLPHVVLVCNGGDWDYNRPMSHVSATGKVIR